MRRIVIGLAGFVGLLGIGVALADQDDDITRGKALVELNCVRCHAVDRSSESSHANAPAFRTLSHRYPLDALEEAFAEGISTGHPDMPEFTATPEQINAILAYLDSVGD
ncbi:MULTISPECIES: c-type cytochrome [Mesorhizobium]|uniref:Cytochrome c n=1 Tax=Mesorhizobium denitrificans TaxID=2294114 RepID=A0A371X689_9HYPH|nr:MULTISPECIES: cytochrome c [Mesorhizobium]RFC64729.1 cytochrome c [Mesorhizobium denitrificans]